jgi:hypothetical protein
VIPCGAGTRIAHKEVSNLRDIEEDYERNDYANGADAANPNKL